MLLIHNVCTLAVTRRTRIVRIHRTTYVLKLINRRRERVIAYTGKFSTGPCPFIMPYRFPISREFRRGPVRVIYYSKAGETNWIFLKIHPRFLFYVRGTKVSAVPKRFATSGAVTTFAIRLSTFSNPNRRLRGDNFSLLHTCGCRKRSTAVRVIYVCRCRSRNSPERKRRKM